MTSAAHMGPSPGPTNGQTFKDSSGQSFFTTVLDYARRAEAWLDARGRWAWLATMVAGFCLAPPAGLLILGYMIWSKRMFGHCTSRRNRHADRFAGFGSRHNRPSGNSAFDSYRDETLRRLSEEQEAFDAFLTRLREARDKSEFDRFMEERAARAAHSEPEAPTADDAPRRGEY